jgi:DNA polymerase I-like protein with 3'-5' exonuclease and polymerase domains
MQLPNIRKLFLPDPGYVLFDCDLSGADAQVVAWEAGDEDLKVAFTRGDKIHVKNFEDLYSRKFDPEKDKKVVPPGEIFPPYDSMKRAVHGTNYGASPRTIAVTLGWSIATAESFQRKWFSKHPGILNWHKTTEYNLSTTRRVENKFGYRRTYFDRLDAVLPQALAWIPQSTVALVCGHGGVKLRKASKDRKSPLFGTQILLQVHDSLVFQTKKEHTTPEFLRSLQQTLQTTVPYRDPLTIGWELAASTNSWGATTAIKWDGSNLDEVLK